MSVKISAFEKDGKQYPTIELKTGGDDKKFGFTFGLSKARLILNNLEEIQKFVEDYAVKEGESTQA